METLIYYYRGLIERGKRYTWREGFSAQGDQGPIYPWMTRKECRADAKTQGKRAVFMYEDNPE